MNRSSGPLLEFENGRVYLNNTLIVRDLNFVIEEKERIALIGRNGAGKTTTIKGILGIGRVKGKLKFYGEDMTKYSTHERIKKFRIGFAPEGARVFPDLTVEENLEMALEFRDDIEASEKDRQMIFEIFPDLKELKERKGSALSGGERKMVAIARALMLSPRLLILDGMMEGLASKVKTKLKDGLEKARERSDLTVLLAEANIWDGISVGEKIILLDRGELLGVFHGDKLTPGEAIRMIHRHAPKLEEEGVVL